MNEVTAVAGKERTGRKRRSLWWLWLLLMLVVFAGGVILGLKLTSMPVPNEILGRYFPELAAPAAATETAPPEILQPAPTPVPTAEAEIAAVTEPEPQPEELQTPEELNTSETAVFGSGKYIGIDAALKAALDHAKRSEDEVEVRGVFRTKDDDGVPVYEVSFTAGGPQYDYMVNAFTGVIESWVISDLHFSETETFGASEQDEALAVAETEDRVDEVKLIEASDAREIAFKHAKVKSADVLRVRTNLEEKDGEAWYTVEFRTSGRSYSYLIDAVTGDVLSFENN